MFSRLVKTKTFWAALGGIIVSVGAIVTGEVTMSAGLQTIFIALVSMFLRDGIAKSGGGS